MSNGVVDFCLSDVISESELVRTESSVEVMFRGRWFTVTDTALSDYDIKEMLYLILMERCD